MPGWRTAAAIRRLECWDEFRSIRSSTLILFGTILLPVIALFAHIPMLGWAKPTPVDPRNFKNPVLDDILDVRGWADQQLPGRGRGDGAAGCREAQFVVWPGGDNSGIADGRWLIAGLELGSGAGFACCLYELMMINVVLAVFQSDPGAAARRQPRACVIFCRTGCARSTTRLVGWPCWRWCILAADFWAADLSRVLNFFYSILAKSDGLRQSTETRAQRHALDRQAAPGQLCRRARNWVRMQDQYDCFFFIADWHALTTDYADTSQVKENSLEVLLDWLAAGLDPERCTMFIQSHVPQHAELHLLFSMITPLGWLERVPTYKEQRENIKKKTWAPTDFSAIRCCSRPTF